MAVDDPLRHHRLRRNGALSTELREPVDVTDRQRVVLVVALGAAAVVAATTASRLLSPADGGWFAYAPNTSVIFNPSRSWIWRDALIWLVAIVSWAVPSLWLFRRQSDDRP